MIFGSGKVSFKGLQESPGYSKGGFSDNMKNFLI